MRQAPSSPAADPVDQAHGARSDKGIPCLHRAHLKEASMHKYILSAAALSAAACATPAMAQDGSRMIQQLEQADANRDGMVSRAEFLAYRAGQFDRLDRNGDAVLNAADMPRFERIKTLMQSRIAAFDSNGDGTVTRAEFASGPTIAFDQADANHDGQVTRAELESARNRVRTQLDQRQP
jgi:Ca2+-binding EF-hand superfamily protein